MSSPGGDKPIELNAVVKFTADAASAEQAGSEGTKRVQAGVRRAASLRVTGGSGGGSRPATPEEIESNIGSSRSAVRNRQLAERRDTLHDQVMQRRGDYHQRVLSGQAQRSTNAVGNEQARQGVRQSNIDRQRGTSDSLSQAAQIRNQNRVVNASRVDSLQQQALTNRASRTAMSTMRAQGDAARAPGYEAIRNQNFAKAQQRFNQQQTLRGNLGLSLGQSARSPFTYYAAAQGNYGPIAGAVGRGLFNAASSSFRQYAAYQSAAGGMFNPVTAGGEAGGAPLSGLGSLAPAMATGGMIAAPFIAGGVLAAGMSALDTPINKSRLGLQASVGGIGDSSNLYAAMLGGASRFSQSSDNAMQIAEALGTAGVTGQSAVNSNVQNALALGSMSGQNPTQFTGMTAQASLGGGMGAEQLGQAYAKLNAQQAVTGISLNKMIDSFKILQQVTGGVNVNVSGLAAVQKIAGAGVNAGQLVSGQSGATGFSALVNSKLLGMSPAQYMAAQSNPATLMDSTAAFLKRATAGQTGAQRTMIAEGLSSSLGLMDTTGMSPSQQSTLVSKMLNGTPGQFQAYANQIQQGSANLTGGQFRSIAAATSGATTSVLDRTMAGLQNIGNMALSHISQNTANLYNIVAQNKGTTVPGGGGGGAGGGTEGGGISGIINRSTTPGGVSNSPFSFSATQTAAIQKAAAKYGVPWQDLAAQVAREGGAWGSAAGGGIGQFEPGTAAGLISNPNSPVYGKAGFTANAGQSLAAMAYMDKSAYGQLGSWQNAFAAYNGGMGGYGVPAAQAYGQDVVAGGQSVQNLNINVTGTINDSSGRQVGTINPSRQSVTKRGAHPVMPVPGQRGEGAGKMSR